MIGHFLLQLSVAQQDAILTSAMQPGTHIKPGEAGCLITTAWRGEATNVRTAWPRRTPGETHIWSQFDALCARFGTPRITAAIRNRILANQARRTLRRVENPARVPVGDGGRPAHEERT